MKRHKDRNETISQIKEKSNLGLGSEAGVWWEQNHKTGHKIHEEEEPYTCRRRRVD